VSQRFNRRFAMWSALGVAMALTACSSPDPVLYTIAMAPGAVQAAAPGIVLLDHVEIPRYLDRSQIVKSSENYRLDVKSNDWWGEPLSSMVRRVLRDELAQRLPQSTVLGSGASGSISPDATIDLDLQRLDEDASGNVVLQAQATLTLKGRKAPAVRSFQFSVPSTAPASPAATTSAGEVGAITIAVGKLADGLAAMLAGR
jgi:uncharacterized protein